MITIQELNYKINVEPKLLNNNIKDTLESILSSKMIKKVFQGAYIIDIISFKYKNSGIINNDGSVSFSTIVTCKTCYPVVGENYKLPITHINKMGVMHKFENVSIFIANHHLLNQDHKVGEIIDITIIGKRIEENMVCVAKEI